jgi:hypothetical protein
LGKWRREVRVILLMGAVREALLVGQEPDWEAAEHLGAEELLEFERWANLSWVEVQAFGR